MPKRTTRRPPLTPIQLLEHPELAPRPVPVRESPRRSTAQPDGDLAGLESSQPQRILFLDLDGVVHPGEVYIGTDGEPELRVSGALFMWQGLLMDALREHPDVRVVLSTDWVSRYGIERTKSFLSPELRARVVDSCVPQRTRLRDTSTHANYVRAYVRRQLLTAAWLAIDDDGDGWGDAPLLRCDPGTGLGDPATLEQLRSWLASTAPSR